MSGKVVIQVENLGKQYRLGSIGGATLREDLGRWWARVRGRPDPWARVDEVGRANAGNEQFWALRDVSFDVREGEVLGVIGRNGAGKSTLLKLLSRITTPTTGRATIRGRVGSLLEVGTGFHPELTGRENVYLNGAILGMTRAEITRKLDEIVEFAEMAKFIDTPVKRYSSGMTVRLAFAVAAHLEPEILIVDEVLAVGDAEFQRKCIGKMKDVAGHGRTVLFVSHNMQAVRSLCTSGLVLRSGRVALAADIETAIEEYMAAADSCSSTSWSGEIHAFDESITLIDLRVDNTASKGAGPNFTSASDVHVRLQLKMRSEMRGLCIGFDLLTSAGEVVMRSYDTDYSEDLVDLTQGDVLTMRCTIPAGLLNAGAYEIAPRIGLHNSAWLIRTDPLVRFETQLDHGATAYWIGLNRTNRPGVIAPILRWQRESSGNSESSQKNIRQKQIDSRNRS